MLVGSYPAEDFFPENFIFAFNTYRYTRTTADGAQLLPCVYTIII